MKFQDIPGHDKLKETLKRTVHENRISHAQLFFGKEGCGKLALALAYAQYINCTNRTDFDSCGRCASCAKYEKLAHPDLHFVFPVAANEQVKKNPISEHFYAQWRELLLEKKGFISYFSWLEHLEIEKKRAIINTADCNAIHEKAAYKTYESEYKIFIIWMVENMFHAAVPKLLKLLEEPADKTLFLLISEDTSRILPTVLSRTQMLKIPSYTSKEMADILEKKYQISRQKAQNISVLSEGNLVEALQLSKSGEDSSFYFEKVKQMFRFSYLMNVKSIHELSREMNSLPRDLQIKVLNYALQTIHLGIERVYKINETKGHNQEEDKFIQDLTKFLSTVNTYDLSLLFEDARFSIKRNLNSTIVFTDLMIQLYKILKR